MGVVLQVKKVDIEFLMEYFTKVMRDSYLETFHKKNSKLIKNRYISDS